MCLKCEYCGNDKDFYHEVTVLAKQKVDPKTLDYIGKPYGVNIEDLCIGEMADGGYRYEAGQESNIFGEKYLEKYNEQFKK